MPRKTQKSASEWVGLHITSDIDMIGEEYQIERIVTIIVTYMAPFWTTVASL